PVLAAILLIVAVGSVAWGFLGWGPNELLAAAQTQRQWALVWVDAQPILAGLVFVTIYVAFTGLSLPGALFLTLIGGAVFGVVWATVLVSFASTAGATIAFLASRFLLHDWVRQKYGERFAAVRRELDRGGCYYLLAVRLNPLVPYFLINLFFGLTAMPTWQFWVVSQMGMLPGTLAYAVAGSQLGTIHRLEDAVAPEVGLTLVLLSVLPLAGRAVSARLLPRRRGVA
ncbi:MAG TPA: TVP38/TMEM64 family protein, partial [Gemmatales bacterium]|nr:TVP38/TMEM64 family protein [Gemmatales bacterium]